MHWPLLDNPAQRGGMLGYRYRSSSGTFGISLVIRCIVPRKRWSSG